jgi:hypothetical protein
MSFILDDLKMARLDSGKVADYKLGTFHRPAWEGK